MTATNSYFQPARPSSPVPKFMSLNVLIFPFDEMQHDVTKWASGRACQHLNWWSCCGEKPWGLMKCSRGRLQKGGGGSSVDTPIGRKMKDERKCRGGQIYSTACAPTRAMWKHHGVFQGPSFLCQTLRASAMTPSALQLFLLTFSVCFSHFLPHTPSLTGS